MVKISITSKSSKLKVPKAEKHNNLQQNIFPPVFNS